MNEAIIELLVAYIRADNPDGPKDGRADYKYADDFQALWFRATGTVLPLGEVRDAVREIR